MVGDEYSRGLSNLRCKECEPAGITMGMLWKYQSEIRDLKKMVVELAQGVDEFKNIGGWANPKDKEQVKRMIEVIDKARFAIEKYKETTNG
jgi:predicted transcriptional regulator